MSCYCCDYKNAKWNFKYGKLLCQICADTLDRLDKYREKMMVLSQSHYNQQIQRTGEGRDIWTNEDESAEIEQQIIDDARR